MTRKPRTARPKLPLDLGLPTHKLDAEELVAHVSAMLQLLQHVSYDRPLIDSLGVLGGIAAQWTVEVGVPEAGYLELVAAFGQAISWHLAHWHGMEQELGLRPKPGEAVH